MYFLIGLFVRIYTQQHTLNRQCKQVIIFVAFRLYTIPEVPLGTLPRLVLEARNTTLKPQSNSTTRAGLRVMMQQLSELLQHVYHIFKEVHVRF